MQQNTIQEFRLEIKCNEKNSVIIIRDWLHICLGELMDVNHGGFVAHGFGSFTYGQVVTGSLFIGSSEDVSEDNLRALLNCPNDQIELLQIRKV